MKNIQFNYLYRDSGNYKNYGTVIFENSEDWNLPEAEQKIRSMLIDRTYFYAAEWNVPALFFEEVNPEEDPSWHEFESLEFTEEPHNTEMTFSQWLSEKLTYNPH